MDIAVPYIVHISAQGGKWITLSDGRHIFIVDDKFYKSPELKIKVKGLRTERMQVTRNLKEKLRTMSSKDDVVDARTKRDSSIINKMKRKSFVEPSKVNDVSGARVIVKDLDSQKDFASKVRHNFNITKEENFVDNPKKGYRGIHFDVDMNGKPAEIQIKTENQEKFSLFARRNRIYKSGTGLIDLPQEKQSFLNRLSDYYYASDKGMKATPPITPTWVKTPYDR